MVYVGTTALGCPLGEAQQSLQAFTTSKPERRDSQTASSITTDNLSTHNEAGPGWILQQVFDLRVKILRRTEHMIK